MATEIGIVNTIIGTAVAIAADGSQRTLQVGDKLFADEIVSTATGSAISIEFVDGSFMDLGQQSQAVLDNDAFNPEQASQKQAEVQDDIEALQQALLDGADPTQEAEATAAGAGSESGNEGTNFIQVLHDGQAVTPTSGFETTGVNVVFDEGIDDDGVFDDSPTAGITTVLLDEDDLYDFRRPGEDNAALHDQLKTTFDDIKAAFVSDSDDIFSAHPHKQWGPGNDDEQEGDDLPPEAKVFVTNVLNADFGNDGPGGVTLNAAATQPSGLTSGGDEIKYWVSDDGHSLVAYIEFEHGRDKGPGPERAIQSNDSQDGGVYTHAHIIFTAQVTDTGEFTVILLGPVDHPDGTTEDNLLVDLGFTIADIDGDTAQGVLQLNIDDDSPVLGYPGRGDKEGSDELSIQRESGPRGQGVLLDEDDTSNGNDDNAIGDDYGQSYYQGAVGHLYLPIQFGADGPAADDAVRLAEAVTAVDSQGNPVPLMSNGQAVTFFWDTDNDQLVGYTDDVDSPVLTISVDYTDENGSQLHIELHDNLDHPNTYALDPESESIIYFDHNPSLPEDNLILNIGYTATDRDGDSVDGAFTVNVDDDSPVIINPETTAVDEEGLGGNAGDSYPVTDVGVATVAQSTSTGNVVDHWIFHHDGGLLTINIDTERYHGDLNGDSSTTSFDSYIYLFDSSNNEVARNDDSNADGPFNLDSYISVNLPAGDYNLAVGTFSLSQAEALSNSQDSPIGTYNVTFGGDNVGVVLSPSGMPAGAVVLDGGLTSGDLPGEDLTASGSLGINWGADDNNNDGGPADRSVAFDAQTAPAGLNSNGNAVSYSISEDGQTLTAYTGSDAAIEANWVFTVELSDLESGSYNFELLNNLDHPEGAVAGEDGSPGTEDDIDLAFAFTATDSDGDSVSSSFTVTVDDDAPVIGQPTDIVLDEEGLNGNAGDSYADSGDVAGEVTSLTANNLDISWGSDDNNTGSANRSVAFNEPQTAPAGLSSNGDAVSYSISTDGQTLTAYTGADAAVEANWVFTVELSDLASGSYDFELLNNLDHDLVDTEDDINLTFDFTATDSDGDTATDSFTVTVDDDAPVFIEQGSATVIHDESAGAQPFDTPDDADLAHDIGTILGFGPLEMLGLAVNPIAGAVSYNAGADGLANVALTDVAGNDLVSVDSGLTTTQTNQPIYLYSVSTEALAAIVIELGGSSADVAGLADNLVVGLTSAGLDLTDIPSLITHYQSDVGNLLADIAFVVGLYEGNTDSSSDDQLAVLQLQAIQHGDDPLDHDDEVSIANVIHLTITDGDGDSVTSDTAITVTFDDDGPSLTVEAAQDAAAELAVELDETVGADRANSPEVADGNTDDAGPGLAQVTTTVTAGLSSLFTLGGDYGADGAGMTTSALSFVGFPEEGSLATNLSATDGGAISLSLNGEVIEGKDTNGDVVFSIAIVDVSLLADPAEYQLQTTLFEAIDHGADDTSLFDEVTNLLLEGDAAVQLQYEVTRVDGDGDEIIQSDVVDLIDSETSVFSFDDDGPLVTATQPDGAEYEFTITNHDEVSSAGYHSSYGYYIKDAAGNPTTGVVVWDDVHDTDTVPVTVTGYAPDQIGFFIIPNGDNQNADLTDNTEVTFSFVGGQWQAFAGGVALTGNGSHVLFDAAALNFDAQDHVEDNGLIGNQNWEDLQIPTGDGDFNDVNINVDWNVIDGTSLTVDETDLADDNAATTASIQMALAGSFAINPGADGLASVEYTFGLVSEDVDSGLVDTLSDDAVLLRTNLAGDIEGYVADGVVFTLVVDETSGEVTLTQLRAVVHGNPEDHDEAVSPATISSGLIAMTATVTDGDGDTASDSIDVGALIAFEDDGPTAVADSDVMTDEDTAVIIDVLANDSVGADGAAISSHSQTTNGTLVLNDDGTFTYTPSANYSGSDSFSYTLTDGDGDTSTTTVTIGVTPVADAPTLIMSVGEPTVTTTEVSSDFGIFIYNGDSSFVSSGGGVVPKDSTTPPNEAVFDALKGYGINGGGGTDGIDKNESILFDMKGDVSSATFSVSVDSLSLNAQWVAFDSNGDPVASGPFSATGTITIENIGDFAFVEFDAAIRGSNGDGGFYVMPVSTLGTTDFMVNGSFEDLGNIDGSGNPILGELTGTSLTHQVSIPGWTTIAGAPMEPHAAAHAGVGTTDGNHYMDLGASPGNSSIEQTFSTLTSGQNYQLSFDYRDKAAMQEGGQAGLDSGVMNVVWNGVVIATIQGNNVDAYESFSINVTATGNDSLVFAEVGVSDDNWGMAIDNVQMFGVNPLVGTASETTYSYELSIAAALTDVDGSESLSGVTITDLPDGVSISTPADIYGTYAPGTLTLVSDHELTGAEINGILGSVTSTETANGDTATTDSNAKVETDYIDFAALSLVSWGGSAQDRAASTATTVTENVLTLAGNSWKAVSLSQFGVDGNFNWANGTLTFESKVTAGGELQGIMFENNLANNSAVDQPNLIKVAGSQTWGTNAAYTSENLADGWVRVEVDLSTLDQSSGEFNNLVFVNDDDNNDPAANGDGTISFRNLSISDNAIDSEIATDNLLEGTAGDDALYGDTGADILIGGAGDDVLFGGDGDDIFIWNDGDEGTITTPAHDVVLDFDTANDVLNLADLLSDPAHGYSIEGIDNGSGDLQLNIGVADGNGSIASPVQEIELTGVAIVGNVEVMLQTLLDTGAINDGI